MKTKTIWLVPLCWAFVWASCTDDGWGGAANKLTQQERDVRAGLSALFASLAAGLVLRELMARGVFT